MKKIVSFFGDQSETFRLLNDRTKEYAASRNVEYLWVSQNPFNKKDVIGHLKNADAGIIDIEPYNEEIFKEIKGHTGILVRFGVGYDNVDIPAASKNGIAIARTTGANTLGVAEMALTLMMAARRELKPNMERVRIGKWEKIVVNETIGSTIGILGFGVIGRAFAELLQGFNANLIACDSLPNEEMAEKYHVKMVSADELFTTSDVISIHVPYSEGTYHLVDAKRLAQMKPASVIICTARGNIIDETALYEALKARRIRGAGLDVMAVEPLPIDSPLIGLDNCILTPHVSSQTMESLWRIYQMAVDISIDFFEGKESPHILNKDYIKGL
jgi:phosphoglycerate dehydrogenase-like enzyme